MSSNTESQTTGKLPDHTKILVTKVYDLIDRIGHNFEEAELYGLLDRALKDAEHRGYASAVEIEAGCRHGE